MVRPDEGIGVHAEGTPEREAIDKELAEESRLDRDPYQWENLWPAIREKKGKRLAEILLKVRGFEYGSKAGFKFEELLTAAVSYKVLFTGTLRNLRERHERQFYSETLLGNLDLWAKRFQDELERRGIDPDIALYAGLRPCTKPNLYGLPKDVKDVAMQGILIPQPAVIKAEREHYRRFTTKAQKLRWNGLPDNDPLSDKPTGIWRVHLFFPSDKIKSLHPSGCPHFLYSVGDYKHDALPIYKNAEYVVIVEGPLAALVLVSRGIPAVATGGYNTWQKGGGNTTKDMRRFFNWAKDTGKRLIVCFDANFDDNTSIETHANALATVAEDNFHVSCKIARIQHDEGLTTEGPDDIPHLDLVKILQDASDCEPTYLPSNAINPNDDRPTVLHGRGVEMIDTAKRLGELCNQTGQFYRKQKIVGEVVFSGTFNRHTFEPKEDKEWPGVWQGLAQLGQKMKDPEDDPEINNMSTAFAGQVAISKQFREQQPEVNLMTNVPVLLPDGSQIVGYHEPTKTLAHGGKEIAMIPLEDARRRLKDELLGEYDPAGDEHTARMLAKLIDSALLFGGFFGNRKATTLVIQANEPQAGKDLFVSIAAAIFNHKVVPIPPSQKAGGGPVLMMNNALVRDDPYINFSNWRKWMDEPDIESVQSITTELWYARILNHNPINVDVRRRWFSITSNGMKYTPDQIARSCVVNILKRRSFNFTHDYPTEVLANWRYFLEAVYSIVADWIDRGKPQCDTTESSYTHWWRVMKEIISHNWPELPPIDHNHAGLLDQASQDDLSTVAEVVCKSRTLDQLLFTGDLMRSAGLSPTKSEVGVFSRHLNSVFNAGQSRVLFGERILRRDSMKDDRGRTRPAYVISIHQPRPDYLPDSM